MAQATPREPQRPALGRALTLVHTGAATTRSELTSRLGLTRTAVGQLVGQLADRKLVAVETHPATEGGTGRPSHRLAPHPDGPVAVAVQLHADALSAATVGLGGARQQVVEQPLPSPPAPGPVLTQVAVVAARLARSTTRPCVGVGVALPSALGDDGSALAALYLDWPAALPVRRLLAAELARHRLRLPVALGNDANLAAVAEHRHGAGRGARHLLYLMTGHRGIGGGLVVNGQLHTGSAGYALEVGHLTVNPGGRPCRCGNSGCLDVEADPAALLAAAGRDQRSGLHEAVTAAREVIRAAAGDPVASAATATVVDHLATGLASLVNVLNPDRIVLGGLLADLLAEHKTQLQRLLAERSFLDQAAAVALHPEQLQSSALLGAAELAMQPLLNDPQRLGSTP
jgi:predicted NBD/HSP70 family sugar kinase